MAFGPELKLIRLWYFRNFIGLTRYFGGEIKDVTTGPSAFQIVETRDQRPSASQQCPDSLSPLPAPSKLLSYRERKKA